MLARARMCSTTRHQPGQSTGANIYEFLRRPSFRSSRRIADGIFCPGCLFAFSMRRRRFGRWREQHTGSGTYADTHTHTHRIHQLANDAQ